VHLVIIAPGHSFGSYELQEQLSSGPFASVFRAHHPNLDRTVAVKVLSPNLAEDPTFSSRFREVAHAVSELRHPNILTLYDFGEQDGVAFLVTAFASGGSLAQFMGTPMPLERVIALLGPLASALDYAHQCGLVHRDVTPANVLLDDAERPILADFGLARIVEGSRLTQPGVLLGTPAYMSPEQAFSTDVGPSSDLYSLGIIAYEMLVGTPPFSAVTPMATMLAQMHEAVPQPTQRNPLIADGVEAVLDRALSKAPEQRFPTADAMLHALQACVVVIEEAPLEAREAVAAVPATGPLPDVSLTTHESPLVTRATLHGGLPAAQETVGYRASRPSTASLSPPGSRVTAAFMIVLTVLLMMVAALVYLLS